MAKCKSKAKPKADEPAARQVLVAPRAEHVLPFPWTTPHCQAAYNEILGLIAGDDEKLLAFLKEGFHRGVEFSHAYRTDPNAVLDPRCTYIARLMDAAQRRYEAGESVHMYFLGLMLGGAFNTLDMEVMLERFALWQRVLDGSRKAARVKQRMATYEEVRRCWEVGSHVEGCPTRIAPDALERFVEEKKRHHPGTSATQVRKGLCAELKKLGFRISLRTSFNKKKQASGEQ